MRQTIKVAGIDGIALTKLDVLDGMEELKVCVGYSLDGERIGMGIISKGFAECGTKKTEEAVAFSVALEAVASWRATESGAELLAEDGTVRVILARSGDGDALGDWVVVSYARANGERARPLPDTPMVITFREDGSAAGSTGCRLFEGQYTSEGDRMVIGPIEPIGLPCKGPERKPERRLLTAFGEVVHWQREGDDLVLTDAFGESLVDLRSAPETSPLASAEPAGPVKSAEPEESAGPVESAEPEE